MAKKKTTDPSPQEEFGPNQEHLEKLTEGVKAWSKWREENPGITPDLKGAKLERAHLKEAYLSGACLEGAELWEAHMEQAFLAGAYLKGAYLSGACLEGARLMGAHMEGANLSVANLEKADLWRANLEGADLRAANLENANVTDVKYNRWARYKGIRVVSCYGSPMFKRFAQDQAFIEEYRSVWWRKPFYLLWLIFADCGRSLWLWAAWSIAFALFFGWKFYELDSYPFSKDAFYINDTGGALPKDLWSYMYYSIVTFTTLGFGDIIPKTAEASRWVVAEVITGYIMLGGLISILAQKLARRS